MKSGQCIFAQLMNSGVHSCFTPIFGPGIQSAHSVSGQVYPIEGVLVGEGQGANSQLGSVRPTYDPSGQTLASKVQIFLPLTQVGSPYLPKKKAPVATASKSNNPVINQIPSLDLLFVEQAV